MTAVPPRPSPSELHAIVLAGGPPLVSVHPQAGARADVVIAADSGLHHAIRLGLSVDVVVGDLDSVDEQALHAAVAAGAVVERHPVAKDQTDLELALDAALARGVDALTVVAGFGGRVDHQLAAALLLASDAYAAVVVDAFLGDARILVLHGGTVSARRAITADPGTTLTLLAVHGPAVGVRTHGLAFALDGEELRAGSTRGVSNLFASDEAVVSIERGTLLAIVTGVVQ